MCFSFMMKVERPANILPIYSEKQFFPRWLLLVIFLAPLITYILSFAGISTKTVGFIPYFLIGPVLAGLLIGLANLKTELRPDGIYFRFTPLHLNWHRISKDEIEKIYIRKYSPIREFGGWGIRGLGDKRAYNTSGNMGLQLELKNGKRILFGTHKPEEWAKAIKGLFADL